MESFTVQPLGPQQILAAFPIIRESAPGVGLAAWVRFAKLTAHPRRASRGGIIVALRCGRAYPTGLLCYRKERDLEFGQVLMVDHFVALDIIDHLPIVIALSDELDTLGQRLGCGAIRTVIPIGSSNITPALAVRGYRLAGTLLSKPVEDASQTLAIREPPARARIINPVFIAN